MSQHKDLKPLAAVVPVGNHHRSQSTKTHLTRVLLSLPDETIEDIDHLVPAFRATSRGEVVKYAVNVLKFVAEAIDHGHHIAVVSHEGEHTRFVLPGLTNRVSPSR